MQNSFIFSKPVFNNRIWIGIRIILGAALLIFAGCLYFLLKTVDDKQYLAEYYPLVMGLIVIVSLFGLIKDKGIRNLPYIGYILSGIISCYYGYNFIAFTQINLHTTKTGHICSFAYSVFIIFMLVNSLFSVIFRKFMVKGFVRNKLTRSFALCIVAGFVYYIFIPSQSYFYNYTDYGFPYEIVLKSVFVDFLFICIVPSILISLLRYKYFYSVCNAIAGMLAASYIQYMFLNGAIGTVDGGSYSIKDNILFVTADAALWIVVIFICMKMGIKKRVYADIISRYSVLFLGFIQLVALVTMITSADEACFNYSAVYYDFDDQYKVGNEDNVIVFIVDAVDNSMIKELYNEGKLNKFDDFMMYTNTCSVYDYTNRSLLQMVTNMPFDSSLNNNQVRDMAWNTPYVNEFFDRLHGAGYKVEFFNFDGESTQNIIGKIDNAHVFDGENDKPQYIGYKYVRKSVTCISSYTLLPNILKPLVDMNKVSFAKAIYYKGGGGNYENEDYEACLNLEQGDNGKYVQYQHIYGTHAPNNNVETAQYCMEIIAEYIEQLKELGVYDNSTIIITSDHGYHNDGKLIGERREASTPMLLIKSKGNDHTGLKTNDAPVYHMDIMPTILQAAGLLNGDYELFGYPVDYYHEGDLRERVWIDRVYDENYPKVGSYNVYYSYTYTGDTKELERVVENGENLEKSEVPRFND